MVAVPSPTAPAPSRLVRLVPVVRLLPRTPVSGPPPSAPPLPPPVSTDEVTPTLSKWEGSVEVFMNGVEQLFILKPTPPKPPESPSRFRIVGLGTPGTLGPFTRPPQSTRPPVRNPPDRR